MSNIDRDWDRLRFFLACLGVFALIGAVCTYLR